MYRCLAIGLARFGVLLAVGLAMGGPIGGAIGSPMGRAMAADKPVPSAPAPRPNIVVLLADDVGFSDLGAYGSEISTPHLDALARRGVRFANFHVSASCSPTRSMLLTGVDNHRNGVGNMRETIPRAHLGKPGYLSVLDRNVVTIATLLRDGGYRTYVAGKWHVGMEPHNLPPQRGFDRSLVQADSGSDNWETGKRYLDISEKVSWFDNGRPAVMPAEYYSSQFFVDKTLEYLRTDAADPRPFFAYVAFQASHIPVQAPRVFVDKYKDRYRDGWHVLRQARRDKAAALGLIPPGAPMAEMATTTDWHRLSAADQQYEARRMAVYAAMTDAMDDQIGRLIAHLKASGAYDNTVFVFLSDNGPEASDPYQTLVARWWLDLNYDRGLEQLGAKGAYSVIGPSWASAAAAPLSTYKFWVGEGGIRVPLIIAGAPGMQQNGIHHSFTHVNDIVPTLLELAGVPRPQSPYRGHPILTPGGASLLPVMRGQAQRVHAPDQPIGLELSGNKALFKGDLKLVQNIAPLGDGQWRLFDLRVDPGETRDLSAAMPQVFREMQADYDAYALANGVLPMPEGYEPLRQVMINAMLNVYLPRYGGPALALLAGLVLLGLWRFRVRQRRLR